MLPPPLPPLFGGAPLLGGACQSKFFGSPPFEGGGVQLLFPAGAGDGAFGAGAVTVIVAPPAAAGGAGAWIVTAAAWLMIVLVLVIVIVLAAPQISCAILGAAREAPESNATAVAEVSFMLGVKRR